MGKQLSGWILNVFFSRDKSVMLTLFNSLVRSRLEYCCEVWNPYKINHISALEKVQRSFTSKINSVKDLNYWDRLKALKIMSLQRRREKLIILFVFKIKNNMVPNDIGLKFVCNNRRSHMQAVVKSMPKNRGKLLTLYENSFVVKAAKLWNKLPHQISTITSHSVFRNKLDAYLNLYPDCPPVSGYYHVNTNSLIDYATIGI